MTYCDLRGQDNSQLYACSWVSTVDDISPEKWEACFGQETVLNCFDMFRALEHSKLPRTSFYYLVGKKNGEVAFIVPCYYYTAPLDVLAPCKVRRFCEAIRKHWPSFLQMKVLIAGNPLAISGDSLGLEQVPREEIPVALAEIKEQFIKQANNLRVHLALLKEIPETKLNDLKQALLPEFIIVPSMPSAYLELSNNPEETYKKRLRNHYRNIYHNRKKAFLRGGGSWRIIDDFAPHAEDLWQLYRQVFEKSKTQFEVLTPEFFCQIAKYLTGRVFVAAGFRDNRCIGFALMIARGNYCSPLYIGLEYSLRDELALYYNLLYCSIEEAEKRGYPLVCLGQTAYESKALLGAKFNNLSLALCPLSLLAAFALRLFKSIFFPIIRIPHHRIFREGKIN